MEQLTLFPQDSPASHSVSPETGRANTMTAISGQKLYGSFLKSDPAGSFLKTFLDCSPYWNQRISHRWKVKRLGYWIRSGEDLQQDLDYDDALSEPLSNRSGGQDIISPGYLTELQSFCVYQLAPQVLPTGATGSGLLPTPTTMDHMGPKTQAALLKEVTAVRPGRRQLANLRDVVAWQPDRLLPTPTTQGGNRKLDPSGLNRDKNGNRYGQSLEQLARAGMLPNPHLEPALQIQDLAHVGYIIPFVQQASKLIPGTFSPLNPRFVGQMMGYPSGWLVSPFQSGAGKPSGDTGMPSCPR